jgi:hypothetical protein
MMPGGLPIVGMIQAFAMSRNVLSSFAAFETESPHGGLERAVLAKAIL